VHNGYAQPSSHWLQTTRLKDNAKRIDPAIIHQFNMLTPPEEAILRRKKNSFRA
jgi:hypothetical protein